MSRSVVPDTTRARRTWPGVVFVVVLVQLCVWNLYVIVRNQDLLGADETPRHRPGNVVTAAANDPSTLVRFYLATFYYLRLLAGKTLVMPAKLADWRFFLEHVSRLHVELASPPPTLGPLSRLRVAELVERNFFIGVSNPVDLVLHPDASRYVMAIDPDGDFVILPEPLYQRLHDELPGDVAAPAVEPTLVPAEASP